MGHIKLDRTQFWVLHWRTFPIPASFNCRILPCSHTQRGGLPGIWNRVCGLHPLKQQLFPFSYTSFT